MVIKETIIGAITLVSTALLPVSHAAAPLLSPIPEHLLFSHQYVLAEQSLDLTIREPEPRANQGFADNILLSLHYLKDDVESPKIDWYWARKPFEVSFTLQPGEVFAFHGNVLSEYSNPVATMNSEFMTYEGYRSVWGLGGNGVCHLASLINWVATEAGLEVIAKANHNFAPIPGVSREYGTSIRSQSSDQNLYVINGFDYPVRFRFVVGNQNIDLCVLKI